jgi:nicotinamidase-related amidase
MDALLVIDVQRAMFASPSSLPHDGEAVVARIAGLIDAARSQGVSVFFVQHDGGPGDDFSKDGPGFAFRPEIAPRDGEAVTVKRMCNSFQQTDLDAKLRAAGIDHLVVCGMQTEYCVDTAIRAAVERGFRVTAVQDAHSTFDSDILPAAAIIAHHNHTWQGSFAALRRAADMDFAR